MIPPDAAGVLETVRPRAESACHATRNSDAPAHPAADPNPVIFENQICLRLLGFQVASQPGV